jgi:hypothetical protein
MDERDPRPDRPMAIPPLVELKRLGQGESTISERR